MSKKDQVFHEKIQPLILSIMFTSSAKQILSQILLQKATTFTVLASIQSSVVRISQERRYSCDD